MFTDVSINATCRIAFCAFMLLSALCANADKPSVKPFLHPLFSDNMVMQREIPAPIWGWAAPGSKVTVGMGGKTATTKTNASGKWLAKLGPFHAGGPYTLTVTGPKKVTVKNVLVGDVWICSGQSNMEMGINSVNNAEAEVAQAQYPKIRLINIPNRIALTPQDTVDAAWQVCTPENMRSGNYTAVGYFFGRKLNADLNVPIGLLQTDWGGTLAEAWASAEALSKMNDFNGLLADLKKYSADPNRPTDAQRMEQWWAQNDPGMANGSNWAEPGYDSSSWKLMKLPQDWDNAGLKGFDGIVWFRKEIDVPLSSAGRGAVLKLGTIDDMDTTWINGVKVGETGQCTIKREYHIPMGVMKPGRNVIAVRVLDIGGGGGLSGAPEDLSLQIDGGSGEMSLASDWQYKAAASLAETKPLPGPRYEDNPNNVTVLYNGMIAPLVPFAIKGAIWYQGESNAGNPVQYRTLLPTMINDWRSRFKVGQFPFLIVQLAGFTDAVQEPVQSGWAELREAQLLTAQNTPKCGLAVAVDIGDAKDIHPKNKQDVGYRLALAAEGIAYNRKIEYSGPAYTKMETEGKSIRLYFDHLGGGLTTKGGDKLRGFAIAGSDKHFVWADAVIDGETIVVSAPSVDSPAAVRYDWANLPDGNLYNEAGLPASPFRTDID